VSLHVGGNRWLTLTGILLVVISMTIRVNAQTGPSYDTVKINEVVINSKNSSSISPGYKITAVDSFLMANYKHQTLSDMLSANSDISIKSYGMGGTATAAFRGTGASHTIIDWNGINLNSPMLGQTDLSLIPVGLIDDINVFYGGASILLNDGGIGGTINLGTKPVWDKKTDVSLNAGMGSFGMYSALAKASTGNSHFQTVTKAFLMKSENDFRYLNDVASAEPVWQTRTNSQVKQQGFIEELYFRNKNYVTSARVWYQNSGRNLPSSMISQQNTGEKQYDESLRTILNYDAIMGKSSITLTGAWVYSKLNYENQLASIDSKNLSNVISAKADIVHPVGSSSNLRIIINDQLSSVNSNNYETDKSRNTATGALSLETKKDRVGTTFLLREILDMKTLLIPDFSAAVQLKLIDGKEYFIRANISRNSKVPSMNDLYWSPGGNPDLKNEYAFVYEASYNMNETISDAVKFRYDLSLFHYNIKDMIQWLPGENSWWTADNIKTVKINGLETSVSLDYSTGQVNSNLKAGYSLNLASSTEQNAETEGTKSMQLMYVPVNQFNVSFRISSGIFYSSWVSDYTGKRYTNVENTKYLPGYLLNNVKAGIKIPVRDSLIDLNLGIDNLFDVDYQTIAYYPLPGRSYFLRLLVQLIK
jgi:vitamin B12 transporter